VPTVVNALVEALAPLLPLRVRTAEFTDPTLIVTGEVWSLVVTCPSPNAAEEALCQATVLWRAW
jgi:hypothetical protein